ncbi:hypothetical protein IL306_009648 [Fusarium sp. DS 682]|nr:hypothetical protein IL306_009648 [Fusarium sp. DS 682]
MTNTSPNVNSMSIEDMFRHMTRPIIVTTNGLMLPGDPSTLSKVTELKATGVVAGNTLCGLRFESPSGETGNMVAPTDIAEGGAIIYQGDENGQRPAIESSLLRRITDTYKIGEIPLPITSKGRMESELPFGYRKVELKLSFIERNSRESKGTINIAKCDGERAVLYFRWNEDILGANGTRALMFEEVVAEGTGACWIVNR